MLMIIPVLLLSFFILFVGFSSIRNEVSAQSCVDYPLVDPRDLTTQGNCKDSDGWVKIDSGDLSSYPVTNASKYCFKASQYTTSEIPDGGFGQEGACTECNIQNCGLSHWSYYIEEEEEKYPEWQIIKDVSDQCVEIRDEVYAKASYTITLRNIGAGSGYITRVVDDLDNKVSQSYVNNISGSGIFDNGYITWSFIGPEKFEPGESMSFTYYLLIPENAYGTYENNVEAYSPAQVLMAAFIRGTLENMVASDGVITDLECKIEQNYCEEVVEESGVWSEWTVDPNDDTREMRTRTIYLWDAEDETHSCGSRTETEYRPVETEMCTVTTTEYGEWSDWTIDPNDDTQEMRTRTVYLWDAEDETYACGENTETEYRPIEDEGDVLGTSTSIVSADTAGGDSLIISLVEFILVILSAVSINYTLKKKLQLK